jgi:hypothetical protein
MFICLTINRLQLRKKSFSQPIFMEHGFNIFMPLEAATSVYS